jgi:hypothetical protein
MEPLDRTVAWTVTNTNLPISFTTTDYKVAVCPAYTNHYSNISYYRTVSTFGATNDYRTASFIAIGW